MEGWGGTAVDGTGAIMSVLWSCGSMINAPGLTLSLTMNQLREQIQVPLSVFFEEREREIVRIERDRISRTAANSSHNKLI